MTVTGVSVRCWNVLLTFRLSLCLLEYLDWCTAGTALLVQVTPTVVKEAPLPAGWDMAYDPITGHHYYIDHENEQTTWDRPTVPTASEACEAGSTAGEAVGSECLEHKEDDSNTAVGVHGGAGTTDTISNTDRNDGTQRENDGTQGEHDGTQDEIHGTPGGKDCTQGDVVIDTTAGAHSGDSDGENDVTTALATPTRSPTPRSPPASSRNTPQRGVVSTTFHGEIVVDEHCPAKAFVVRDDPNSDCGSVGVPIGGIASACLLT